MSSERAEHDRSLIDQRRELNGLAAKLLSAADLEFDHSSPLQQALIGTFFFGMAHAHGMTVGLSAPEVHALAIAAFEDTFHYTQEAAVQAVDECISAMISGHHDTMNAILHRGVEGHRQFMAGDQQGLRQNMVSILEHFAGNAN